MTFITKRHLNRRTLLRGMGVSLALPLLDSMVPAQTPLAGTAANAKSRLACVYVPHGATMYKWTPEQEGSGFAFTETLQPLEKFREYINVVTNLAHPAAGGEGSDAGGDHVRSAAVFLSGTHPERDTIRVGATLDQVAASQIGQDTPLPSIELGIEDLGSNCGAPYGCAYANTISWQTPTLPLPMENNPQVLFERLFGDGATAEERLQRKLEDRSILDAVTRKVARLNGGLPAGDRTRIDEYLDGIREIERRLQKAEQQADSNADIPEAPVGIPQTFDEHVKLMFDLQALAFQAEITRVATMMYARDLSGSTYPLSGVRDAFHSASHHADLRPNMDKFALINKYHVQTFAYFVEKLRNTPDGDGNLLDHSMLLYGSGMSNGNQHDHDPLPVVVAGKASGQLEGGRHLKFPQHTPMSNLLLSMLNKLGIQQDQFGDSTGKLEI